MGLLRLTVLGPPEVVHDGTRLTFALRKAQALLLYLAVEGAMHSRGKLAAFLWPDSAPHDGRTALRNAIALLRTLLADPDASSAMNTHLISERDQLGLNPQTPFELDLAVVQQAYTVAQRHSTLPAESQRAALVAKFQQALALVRGPFLDGFWLGEESPFDEWVLQEQQQWQVRVQLLCERLSAFQEAGGEWEQAHATLTRWLAFDAISYIRFTVFPANMTGNTVLIGIGIGTGQVEHLLLSGVALLAYCLGVFLAAIVIKRDEKQDPWSGRFLATLIIETLALLSFAFLLFVPGPGTNTGSRVVLLCRGSGLSLFLLLSVGQRFKSRSMTLLITLS